MAYKVHISDESGHGIQGTVYFYDADGLKIGEFAVPVEGGDAPPDLVEKATTFQVDSPGYIGYAVLQLGELNNFQLVADNSKKQLGGILLIAILAGLGKLLKLY